MKLSPRGQKVLKTVHIISVIAWGGSAIVMNCIRHLVSINDSAGMFYMADFLEAVDMKILVPGAITCLLTGSLYSVSTSWGFFKYRWITVKWVLTILMIALGTFFMGPLIKENVSIGHDLMTGSGQSFAAGYWHNVAASEKWGMLQICLLAFTIIISVFKPWKRR